MRIGNDIKNVSLHIALVFLIMVLMLLAFPVRMFAAETHLFELDDTQDIVVAILYEGDEPTIRMEGPGDDNIYATDSDYAKVEKTDGVLYYFIEDAPAGKWNIISSGKIDYDVSGWHRPLSVDQFEFNLSQKDVLHVYAMVTSEKDGRYDWYIYAIERDENGKTRNSHFLGMYSGELNEKSEVSVDISDVPDGANWYLSMEAVVEYPDGIETQGTATTDAVFAVAGHTITGDPERLRSIFDLTDGVLTIQWDEELAEGFFYLRLEVQQNKELLMDEIVNANDGEASVVVNPEGEPIILRAIALDKEENGRELARFERTIDSSSEVDISIDTESVTSDVMATVSYRTGEKEVQLLARSGDKEQAFRISGEGMLSLPLEELENNEMTLLYSFEPGIFYEQHKTITVQSVPPSLQLYGVSDGMHVSEDKWEMTGSTDVGVEVMVNDDSVPVNNEGIFTYTLSLKDGENDVTVTATDSRGLKSSRAMKIFHSKDGIVAISESERKTGIGVFFIAFIIAVMSALVLLLTGIIAEHKNLSPFSRGFRMIGSALLLVVIGGVAMAAYSLLIYRQTTDAISGSNLVELLREFRYQSVLEALQSRDVWSNRMRIGMLISIGGVLAWLVLLVFGKVIQKDILGRLRKNRKNADRGPKRTGARRLGQRIIRKKDMEAHFCPHCGASIKPGVRFCAKCGTSIADE